MSENKKTTTSKNTADVDIEVVNENQVVDPEKQGSKFMLPKTWVSEKQILKLMQRTPSEHVYKRPGKGGSTWDFVTGVYVKKVLNFVFGWNWDFEVVQFDIKGDMVIVLGKLTVKDDKSNQSITKMQFGRAEVKMMKGTNKPLDIGNDLKAATTDALKKCASELGIASDIYGKNEFKDIGKAVKEKATPAPKAIKAPQASSKKAEAPKLACSKCEKPVTPQEAEFSKKMFRKQLCRNCQAIARSQKNAK